MRRRGLSLVLAAWALTLLNNAFIIAPAPLYPTLTAELALSNAQAGGLVSAFLLTIMLVQIPAGFLIDRFDNRRIVVVASVALALSAVIPALVPTYPVLIGQRLLAGALTAFIFVPLANMVTRAYYPDHATPLGIFLSGPPSGMAVGLLLASPLSSAVGWPLAFSLFAFLIPAVLPWLLIAARPFDLSGKGFTATTYVKLFRNRQLWLVGLAFACTYSGYIFFVTWMPAYVSGPLGADLATAGLLAAIVPAMGILARPLGGWAVGGPFSRDRRLPLALGFLGIAAVTASLWFLRAPVAFFLLPAAGFLAQFPFSVYYVLGRGLLPSEFSGTAMSFLNTTSLIGGTVTPFAAGYLRDMTGGFGAAFQMMIAVSIVGAALLLVLRR